MRVALLGTMAPFVYGGAELLVDSLASKLSEYGHEVEKVNLPFEWEPWEKALESALAFRLLNIQGADKLIAFKFPAYCVKHDNLSIWLLHQFRQVYDLWGTEYGPPQTSETFLLKESITALDTAALSGRTIYTNSKTVSNRLIKHNGIHSTVLYPPLPDEEIFSCTEYGNYIFYPSRVNHSKRQHLAVEAIKHTKSEVNLIIAGKGDSKADEDLLIRTIENLGIGDRVIYINRYISQEEKADFYSRALGVIYIPYDEDSYGYVTLEAFQSRKPVISCTDSGGTDVVVIDKETGYMTESTPEALGGAMDIMYNDKGNAKNMGEAGYELIGKLGISWDNVITRLLS